jgi:GT2 family glycosyltransferase
VSDLQAAPVQAASISVASQLDATPTEDAISGDAPPVVAVVVASNPGDQFAAMLQSLGEQDYENLSVLVIDAGSDEPIADRVADVLPEAYLHRLTGDPGWSVAANQSIELVSGSPFLLFCHDDVVLDEACVSTLMGELYRQNAGIAGPKAVSWDDDRRLLQIGMGSDRFGVLVDQVERGEFDQEQYDDVRDVFVAPGGVQLVRADLFAALGGFDPGIGVLGEDLDLCWRAHALGARVLAVSRATVRHREAMDERLTFRERQKLTTRHRLRTVMVTATGRTRFTVVPLAVFLIVLEGIYYLLSGRRGQARDMFAAIAWNFARIGDIRRRRRALRQIRQKSERDVRELQIGGSAALNSFSRGQFTAGQDRFSGFLGAIRSSFQGEDSGSLRDATVLGFGIAIVLIFGGRHLLTRGVPPVGQFPIVPGARALFDEWWGGWRSTGTGGAGNPPTALAMLAAGRAVFFWAPSLFDKVLAVGPVFLGVFGAFRLSRPLGSARSATVAAAFYAASPLIVSSYAGGRWESLVLYAAAPFLIGSLLRIDGVSPFGSDGGEPGIRVVPRSVPVLLIRFGILVAVVGAFVPSFLLVAALTALAFGLSTLFTNRLDKLPEFGFAAMVAIIVPASLHLPWTYDILRLFSWRWLVGPSSPESGDETLLDLLQFATTDNVPNLFSLGLIVAAVVGLLASPTRLFGIATQCWTVALVLIGLVWVGTRGWLPFDLPTAESMLAPALAALTVVVAIAVRGAEEGSASLSRLKTGGRRGVIFLSAVSLVAGALGAILMSLNGGWHTPTQNYPAFTEFLAEGEDGPGGGRVLWIGDASVVPIDVSVTASGVQYAMTDGGVPEVWGRWSAGPVGETRSAGNQLDLAWAGETVRLGRLLAPYGINLVVVLDQLAPAPYEGPTVDPDPGVVEALTQQLDLERVPGVPNLIVFRNVSAGGVASALPSAEAAEAVTSADQLDVDLSSGDPVGFSQVGSGQWELEAPGELPVLVGVPRDGLQLGGHDAELIAGFNDLTVVPASVTGPAELQYPIPIGRRLVIAAQVVLVVFGAILAQTRREVRP